MPTNYELSVYSAVLSVVAALGVGGYQYFRSQSGLLYSPSGVRLLTSGDLRAVAGQRPQKLLLLVVTGKVYNVTAGRGYYAAGEGYEGFAGGRDASRAFIDTDLFDRDGVDDLANLTLSDCTGVDHWRNFYTNHETYRFAGLHIGKFYDAEGQPTDALHDFEACARNAVEVTEVLKGFAAKAEADGKCAWQHTEPRFVECAPPLVPLRFEMPEKGMVCTCVDSPVLLAALDATVKRPAGQFLPKPYDACTLDQSRCMLTPKKKAGTKQ